MGWRLNIFLVFITQIYLPVPEDVKLKHFFIIEIPDRKELQQITFNHSSDIDWKYFLELYRRCTESNINFLPLMLPFR